ncbi:reverse transcriptase domain-containing protein [Tanacetum coccineum]
MRTRSQSRNLNRQQQQAPPAFVEPFNLEEPIENPAPPVVTMDDNRTMAQLLEAPTEGYEDAIVVPEITADNFELKHGLLTLVQNKQFFGHDKEDPHAHIRYFNKITSTMKFPNVPSTSVKLMLFPFSLEGAARIWLEKEPPRSILTWDDLVSKFINKFFPPSKTTNLQNEITRFQQRFDETFYEAWDRFNDLLRAYSLNSAAGGNFLDKMPRDCLRIIESKSKVRNSRNKPVVAKVSSSTSTPGISPDVAELKDMVKTLLLDKKSQAPTPIKAVEESCVTCGGAYSYRNCPATNGNVYRDNIQYGYIKNHKKIVKNEQARTRESEEYKKKPKNQKPEAKPEKSSLRLILNINNLVDFITKLLSTKAPPGSYEGRIHQYMAQLLEAPTVGYEDAIVVPEITADNFELKHGLLTLVQNKQFFGHDKEDPHAHIRYFNKITSTMKFPNVSSTSVKLMLFPFSLEGAARIWLEKEPPRSILTWDDLVSKFINKFFPPSKTTNLRNEITRFQQRFDETFYEAWDRFNDLLRACPHHGFSELHQLDTFYNALNSNDQDSLNSAAGGNFLDKMPRDCLRIIESKSKVRNSRNKLVVAKVSSSSSTPGISPDVAELKDMVKALLLDKKNQTSSRSGTLPSNTITNPKVDLKGITTRSGVAYQGPSIPITSSSLPKVVEHETEVTKDMNLSHKTGRALIDVYEGELTLRVGKEAVTFNLDQTSRYSSNYNDITANQIDVIEMAFEEYSQEVLGFSDVIASGNPTPDFLLEEVNAFLALEDDPTSPEVNDSYYDPEGDILLLESFLNDDPSPPPNQGNYLPEIRKELKICEAKTDKSSIDEPPEVELKDLPPHLEYAFLEGDNKLPVIIAKDLSVEEKAALIKVLKSHKRAIAWKLSDIKGINPEFCTHKILMEEDYKLAVQHQR